MFIITESQYVCLLIINIQNIKMAKAEKPKFRSFYVINIKLRNKTNKEDASPEAYANLFNRMYVRKIHEESSSGKHCIIKTLFAEKEEKKLLYYSGTLAQFTYITNEKWLDINSLDLDEEFKVREGLFPDAVFTDYIFIPEAHRFAFRTAGNISISPVPVKQFLERALEEASKKDEYIQVDVESDRASLDDIMSAMEIKKLTIDINYSNFDNTSDYQKFVEDQIRESNTSRLKIEATQKPDVSIDINKSVMLKGAIESSLSNGQTIARIINKNGQAETIKTVNYPLKDAVFSTMITFHQELYNKLMNLFRPKKKR